jgi:hypothetical protein
MLKILPTLDSWRGSKLQKQEWHCIISELEPGPARRTGHFGARFTGSVAGCHRKPRRIVK